MSTKEALSRAIAAAGSQAALASKIGVSQAHVSYWLVSSKSGVPANKVIDIERATGVSRHDLRPDIYPEDNRETAA